MKKLTLSLVLLAFLLTACGGTATPVPTLAPVKENRSIVVAEGNLLPDPSVELSFAQPGILAEVLVAEGDSGGGGANHRAPRKQRVPAS